MEWRRFTAFMIVGATVFLVLYDLVTYAVAGNDATISRVMLTMTEQNPAFAIFVSMNFGVLIGHLFLPQRVSDAK